ncbi:asparagine synthase-domain-containing protein [Microdochium bolleyi]|uniref:Asparagine synthase-domain-containing protein n=1 Tax=Microdochium bolleyi TaxID=196109 RepID=A0A136J3M8_9PEZI|nr:asparagine synthase-domain-containing protein [Microdochium bolleyi]
MCGIHAVIGVRSSAHPELTGPLKQSLQNRGPDHLGHTGRTIPLRSENVSNSNDTRALHLSFTSTVLALRGDHVARQPLQDSRYEGDGSVLCWNGEAWRFDDQPVPGNDGEALLSRLSLRSTPDDPSARQEHVLRIFRSIQGPFAVVYYDALDRRVYYGRDRLGRRSLLMHKVEGTDGDIAVSFSSIAGQPVSDWAEVAADGLYSLKLDAFETATAQFDHIPDRHSWLDAEPEANMVSNIGSFNAATDKPGVSCTQAPEAPYVDELERQLMASLHLRVVDVPQPPCNPHFLDEDAVDTRVAILFSGGLDCTVLARLAHDLVPATQGLDLINVAFENPRLVAQYLKLPEGQRATDFYETCPDRITGRKAFAELQRACPERSWRLIAVNVPFPEAMAHKSTVVSLIHPHDTEMDLSIAIALYFAARGTGHPYTTTSSNESSPPSAPCSAVVTSPARVLLSGLGADELFGGYARHDVAYKRAGYPGLAEELRLDVGRIGQRNLGRDDRVMAHWGKEVRFPFLDEEVVRFAIGLPVWAKCDFGWQPPEKQGEDDDEPGTGAASDIEPAKRILRLLADRKGLPLAAREKKRAIQFGSRTAKMESTTGRVKGTASIAQQPSLP